MTQLQRTGQSVSSSTFTVTSARHLRRMPHPRGLTSRAPVVGFRPDLNKEEQLQRISEHTAAQKKRLATQEIHGATFHPECEESWSDSVPACKWRLKTLLVCAATYQKERNAKRRAAPPSPWQQPVVEDELTKADVRSICQDVDIFYNPKHLLLAGGPRKAYQNVRKQLFTMNLFGAWIVTKK